MSALLELWRLLSPQQRRGVLACQAIAVAMALFTVTGIASIAPFFAALGDPQATNRNRSLHWLYVQGGFASQRDFAVALGLAFVAMVLISNLVNAFGTVAMNRLALRIGSELQAALFGEYLTRSYEFHIASSSGTLVNNILHETTRVTDGILQNGIALLTNLAAGSFIVASVLWLDARVAAAMLIALAAGYALIYLRARGRLLRLGQAHSRAWHDRARIVNESFGAIRDVLLMPDPGVVRQAFDDACRDVSQTAANIHLAGQIPRQAMEIVALASLVGMLLLADAFDAGIGPWLGRLTFVAFAAYRLLPILQQIFAASVRMRADSAALMAIAPALRGAGTRRARSAAWATAADCGWRQRPREEIRLEQLSYRYTAERPCVLDRVNLRIPAHAVIGLVGANGSGKTTLMDLIAGLLVPTAGTVRVDGIALDQTNRAAWRSQIAYVPQNVFLLDASIEHNIAFGLASGAIDRARLEQAVRLAQLEELVACQPRGYAQVIGERGIALSGGQRQRVGIARALYKQASLLLLDEALSALDGMTEGQLMAALESLRGRCTMVLIAHSASMVRRCDRIIQLEGGRIGAAGTYEELARRSAPFRRTIGS